MLSPIFVPVLVLLFVTLWFIIRGDLFYVLPCVILFLCLSVLFSIANTSLGEERERERERESYFWCFSYVCACLVLFVSSASCCLVRAAVCDCGTPWTFLSSLFYIYRRKILQNWVLKYQVINFEFWNYCAFNIFQKIVFFFFHLQTFIMIQCKTICRIYLSIKKYSSHWLLKYQMFSLFPQ